MPIFAVKLLRLVKLNRLKQQLPFRSPYMDQIQLLVLLHESLPEINIHLLCQNTPNETHE
jgi:hypothetical protein